MSCGLNDEDHDDTTPNRYKVTKMCFFFGRYCAIAYSVLFINKSIYHLSSIACIHPLLLSLMPLSLFWANCYNLSSSSSHRPPLTILILYSWKWLACNVVSPPCGLWINHQIDFSSNLTQGIDKTLLTVDYPFIITITWSCNLKNLLKPCQAFSYLNVSPLRRGATSD